MEFGSYFNPEMFDVYLKLLRLFNHINIDIANFNGSNAKGRTSVHGNNGLGIAQPKNIIFMEINEIMKETVIDSQEAKKAFKGFF
jgi:hypothetical protein